jgi:hypothetical protein
VRETLKKKGMANLGVRLWLEKFKKETNQTK